MSDMTEQMAESAVLKLASKVVLVGMAGAVAWAISLLLQIDKRDGIQSERMENIVQQIEAISKEMDARQLEVFRRMDEKTKERYTASDARADKAQQAAIDTIQTAALERILSRLDRIEEDNKENLDFWGKAYNKSPSLD